MEEKSPLGPTFPPFPSPPADDAITRLQFLLNNSLQGVVDAVTGVLPKAPARKPNFTVIPSEDKYTAEELNAEIVDRSERLGLILETMEKEIDQLPDSTRDKGSWEQELHILQKENDTAAVELERMSKLTEKFHDITRKQLKTLVQAQRFIGLVK